MHGKECLARQIHSQTPGSGLHDDDVPPGDFDLKSRGDLTFAVWDLLHQFGYRYYFPSATWEVVPKRRQLRIAVDRLERADFYNRSAPRGGMRRNLRPWSIPEWRQWQIRNRTGSSFVLHTGHAYDGILSRHQAEFDRHPEYLALHNGHRGGNKFCISNPELRDLVVRDALAQIQAHPGRDSVSLDPSDGGGWCECQPCREMGSVSDRAILLANAAAEAINKPGHGEKYVGTYAYNYHSPPPSVKVHPNVVVSLATAFIKGDQTFDEMLAGWSEKAELIGIREYYGLPVWHQSMPGSGKADGRFRSHSRFAINTPPGPDSSTPNRTTRGARTDWVTTSQAACCGMSTRRHRG